MAEKKSINNFRDFFRKKFCKKESSNCHSEKNCASGCGFYFLGIIVAAVYNISQTSGFWNIVLALLKAIVWPAFLVYGLMKFLGL